MDLRKFEDWKKRFQSGLRTKKVKRRGSLERLAGGVPNIVSHKRKDFCIIDTTTEEESNNGS